ncbi:uncharacterized protein [Dermacentor albipictus]|uniref:uncharacterized protein isoform X2 n=1 Tax=Dermacentor albipictus TaxID=60249 RepID=UPI0031FD798F
MADASSAVCSSRSALEAPPAASAGNAHAAVVSAADESGSGDGASEQQAGAPPYFVSCSDACFCAFCILFVVALSLSFALGIAYVQGVVGDVATPPGAANYGSLLSSVLAGSRRQEAAPAARTVNDSFAVR